jgi:CubicO group peptidase (beta-lactamase class C family)
MTIFNRITGLWLLAVVFFNLAGFAQESYDFQSLDEYIEASVDLFERPGASVGIIKNGDVLFSKGYGVRNSESGELVNTETIFGIASCTKAFTAAALAILVDKGKIKWEDHVVDHYPEFAMFDPYITSEMRVNDLVCHRSGLQTFDGDLLWYGSDYDREEVVKRIRFRENPYSFRAKYGYQNVMFIAAGELIENVSGDTWDDFLDENIFTPLQMDQSTTTNRHFEPGMNIAYPHLKGKPMEFINYDNCGPAASINSNIVDLLKWIDLMLSKGTFQDKEVFSEQQYRLLTSPHTIINRNVNETIGGTHFFTYGLGWFMYDLEGRKIIEHGGGVPGFHSKVVFIPEDSVGFVILANQLSGFVEAIYKKTLDFLLKKEGQDWSKLYHDWEENQEIKKKEEKELKEASRIEGTKPSRALADYVGLYEDKMYGLAEISLEGEQLKLTLLPSKELFTGILDHWHFDTFKFSFNDPFLPGGYITFNLNKEAAPVSFTIDLKNPDFHFYKLKFERIQEPSN